MYDPAEAAPDVIRSGIFRKDRAAVEWKGRQSIQFAAIAL